METNQKLVYDIENQYCQLDQDSLTTPSHSQNETNSHIAHLHRKMVEIKLFLATLA